MGQLAEPGGQVGRSRLPSQTSSIRPPLPSAKSGSRTLLQTTQAPPLHLCVPLGSAASQSHPRHHTCPSMGMGRARPGCPSSRVLRSPRAPAHQPVSWGWPGCSAHSHMGPRLLATDRQGLPETPLECGVQAQAHGPAVWWRPAVRPTLPTEPLRFPLGLAPGLHTCPGGAPQAHSAGLLPAPSPGPVLGPVLGAGAIPHPPERALPRRPCSCRGAAPGPSPRANPPPHDAPSHPPACLGSYCQGDWLQVGTRQQAGASTTHVPQ